MKTTLQVALKINQGNLKIVEHHAPTLLCIFASALTSYACGSLDAFPPDQTATIDILSAACNCITAYTKGPHKSTSGYTESWALLLSAVADALGSYGRSSKTVGKTDSSSWRSVWRLVIRTLEQPPQDDDLYFDSDVLNAWIHIFEISFQRYYEMERPEKFKMNYNTEDVRNGATRQPEDPNKINCVSRYKAKDTVPDLHLLQSTYKLILLDGDPASRTTRSQALLLRYRCRDVINSVIEALRHILPGACHHSRTHSFPARCLHKLSRSAWAAVSDLITEVSTRFMEEIRAHPPSEQDILALRVFVLSIWETVHFKETLPPEGLGKLFLALAGPLFVRVHQA